MTIAVDALTFDAVIGILDFERERSQRVRVDAEIFYTYSSGRYIDYAEVANVIKSVIRDGAFGLLEEALDALQNRLKNDFPLIETLTLSIGKPDILPDCSVTLRETYNF